MNDDFDYCNECEDFSEDLEEDEQKDWVLSDNSDRYRDVMSYK